MTRNRISAAEIIFIAVTGFLTILICSKSSPLYPINDWVDANTYLTIGRAMHDGAVPYRDLYEQKGPILYFLHAAAALISDSSFFGVFLIESAACAVFLTVSYRILLNFGISRPLGLIPLISMVIYSSGAFCHGDSAEELCLPLLACSLCMAFETLGRGKPLTFRQWFVSGVLCMVVFWTKFSLMGFYAAFFIAALSFAVKENVTTAVKGVMWTASGAISVTLPVLLYFAFNGALYELFDVYFADNLFRYGASTPLTANLTDGAKFSFIHLTIPAVIIILGAAAFAFRKRNREFLLFVFILAVTFLSVFGGHLSYRYYPLPLAVFVPVAVGAIPDGYRFRLSAVSCIAAQAVCVLFCFMRSPNVYLMKYAKKELPQYKFAEFTAEEDSPSMLNYGFIDGGFYLASGIVPEHKYFCRNNMDVPEMIRAQDDYVQGKSVDFIVMRSAEPTLKEAPDGYTLVCTAEFPYYEKYFYYYLYKLG